MAILLYCVAKDDAPDTELLTGVAGDPVVRIELADLAMFTSSNAEKSNWLRPQLQSSALEFHRVLSKVFNSIAIVPFRFPTIFDDEEQLSERMRERASEYAALLDKFRELAQMEIRITNPDLKNPAESGAQYLKLRQTSSSMIDKFTAELRATLSKMSQDWRQRPSKDGIRTFVLIHRNHVGDFRNIMRDTPVPRELTVRVSGPWPVSEFIEAS
ncbi:MAG: GvpL/GvpF family gas vesicle protein [Terriglobales bacterium]